MHAQPGWNRRPVTHESAVYAAYRSSGVDMRLSAAGEADDNDYFMNRTEDSLVANSSVPHAFGGGPMPRAHHRIRRHPLSPAAREDTHSGPQRARDISRGSSHMPAL